ncbi:basic amino acid ABC transporter substrate-binding protein [Lachnospiraceae bacterium 62-35]
MKKKALVLSMAAMLVMSLAACGGKAEETTEAPASAEEAGSEGAGEASSEETGAGEESAADKGEAAGGVLVMGTNAEFPPYEFREGGEIVGIDVEIVSAIAEELGMELQIEDMAFESIFTAVGSGKIDIGAGGITVTEDRKLSMDFSDTYATASQKVIIKEGSDITSPDDLAGKVIGVQLGTTGDLYCSDLESEGSTVERYNKGFEAVQSLLQDKVDAVVIDSEPAKVFVEQSEGLVILDESFTDEEYAFIVKKGNTELLDKVNAALKKLGEEGKLDEIVGKYIKAE